MEGTSKTCAVAATTMNTMARLLGIDVGTSGCKVLLLDERGKVLAQASAQYPLQTPRPGWSEQNPEDWWEGVCRCLREIGERRPDAIGLTGQMHGSVFLDDEGQVVRPALLWNDQRTVEQVEEIERTVGASRVRAITCNPPLTGFQAPKLLWLRNAEPDAYRRSTSLLLPKDYIRYRLTGIFASEFSDASGTGLLDVPARRWSSEILQALEISPDLLPELHESWVPSSQTRRSAELDAGIPVVGGAGDQAAGAVGAGAIRPGVVSVSLGTSGVVFTALDEPKADPRGAAHTFCHADGGWHAMGVMLSCGGALSWYKNLRGASYSALEEEAARAPVGCDGLTFLPYLTGERCPHNDPHARASWAGLISLHEAAHLSRSVFEGVSFGLRDCLELLRSMGADAEEVRVVGGGASSAFWLEVLADVFEMDCVTLESDEGPAFGAALLAGVGVGVWNDVAEACDRTVRAKNRVTPRGDDYAKAYERYRGLYPATRDWQSGSP
jgi:xylulokinase